MRLFTFPSLLTCLLVVGHGDVSAQAQSSPVAIENVAIVDVERGEVTGPKTVLIEERRIAALGTDLAIPAAARRVDGRGRYLIPGLVDMHVHLFNNATQRPPNEWAFPLLIANGVTGVREMACSVEDLKTVAEWRSRLGRGDLVAPRLLAAGVTLGAESPDEARQRTREAHSAGADFLKVFSNVPRPIWRAALEEAQGLKLLMCGHIPDDVNVLEAAQAGQATNEHLTRLYEACATQSGAGERQVLESFDEKLCHRTAASLAQTRQTQVPTLVLSHVQARGWGENPREDKRWAYLRHDEQERWERILREDPRDEVAERRREVSLQIVKLLHTERVRILAGSDAPMPLVYPGYALHEELELLVEAGLTPADALRAATIWPAEFLRVNGSSGWIAVGKRADLVLLDANPLEDISHTQRIRAVVLDGRLLDRAELDALLASAAR